MTLAAELAGCHPTPHAVTAPRSSRPAEAVTERVDAAVSSDAVVHESPDATRARCERDALVARLAAQRVDRHQFARAVLYTWTTAEQAAELRHGGPLLVRETSPTHGVSLVEVRLEQLAAAGDPIARTLREPRFRKARFAWANPWATLRGWEGETYGDQLVRVTLRDEAWIVRVAAASNALEAIDLENRPVALDRVRAHPERIGAIHYVHDVENLPGSYAAEHAIDPHPFREYVLPNESMIARWELGTDGVHASIADAVDLVTAMRAWVASHCAPAQGTPRSFATAWSDDLHADNPFDAWVLASALDNERYRPSVDTMQRLLDALRAVPRTPAFEGHPAQGVAPPARTPARLEAWPAGPPAPLVRPTGTYAGTYFR